MGPTAARHTLAELQFPSFHPQLKGPAALEPPMRADPQWMSSSVSSSPTSIASHTTSSGTMTTSSSTSQPLPSFTLELQSSGSYYTGGSCSSSSTSTSTSSTTSSHVPFRPPIMSLSTPTGYYTQQQLLPPRDGPTYASSSSAASVGASSSSWSGPNYPSDSAMVLGDYLHATHHPPPPPPSSIPPPPHPSQVVLHPLVLQHSEPLPRSNDDDLAMDAQMLREVLQGMPTGQTPVTGNHSHHHIHHHHPPHHSHHHHTTQGRGQPSPMPGLQLLFASPMHSSDLPTASQPSLVPGFYSTAMAMASTQADLLLAASHPTTTSSHAAPATAPSAMFPSLAPTADRGATGAYDSLGLTANPSALALTSLAQEPPRKKRSSATRICKVDGCTKGIRSRGLCKAHGGGRRCTTPGCTTSDQGGGHCVLHGGGRRCRIEGCKKSAQWRGVCKMHGGARRCRYGQCTKNGQVKQGYCRMHHNLLTEQRQQQEQLQLLQLQQLRQQLPAEGSI